MLDFLKSVYESENLETLWNLHCDHMAQFGFDRLIYGYTRFITPQQIHGPKDDSLFLHNVDPEHFRAFIESELYHNAPMLRWARHNTGAQSWSWVNTIRHDLTPEEQSVLRLNKSHGVNAGYTISFADASSRARGLISLVAREGLTQADVDALWNTHGRAFEAMNNVVHLKIISLPHHEHMPRLSERQREVLEWVADGKTNQDIATILGVKTATIEKHLRLVREKLGVETTAQAVLKASFQNQIFTI
ncbi:LuxR family transcriptional regulator [Aliiroseovarius subalbicans]|uniref:LuxR family transcriptional regulator n=1 Tax=Aliiroseovarius subalbicans TaxID=2925840 RepID=UPI001F58E8DC|nr:LuxR family transcriptional regulator [Aliiroseovarius subalbicans]MCI2398424.1 LuxR family transcriptional regulator [Aliiroseovarius subalbicans]